MYSSMDDHTSWRSRTEREAAAEIQRLRVALRTLLDEARERGGALSIGEKLGVRALGDTDGDAGRPLLQAIADWERVNGTVAAIRPHEYAELCEAIKRAALVGSARQALGDTNGR
jgi:hypothetical protein